MTVAVRRARRVTLGLAAFDAGFAAVAVARPELPTRLVDAEAGGFYSDWGVGQLIGYAIVQAVAGTRPSRSRLDAVAGLRTVAIAADLLAARRSAPARRAFFLVVAAGNAVAALLVRQAARELSARRDAQA